MPTNLSETFAYTETTLEELEAPLTAPTEVSEMEIKRYMRGRWFLTPAGNSSKPLFWDSETDQTGVTLELIHYATRCKFGKACDLSANAFIPVAQWTAYRPHASRVVRVDNYVVRNTWRPPHIITPATEDDVAPLFEFLAKVFPDEPEAVDYLLDTLAFRAQARELPRQELIICLYSPEGATGKGAIMDVIDYAFGPASFKRTDFRSAFSDMNANENWELNFVLLDETTLEFRHMAKIRSTVSARTSDANAKGLGSIRYETIALPVLACNEPPSLDDPTARRTLLLRSHLADVMELDERTHYLTQFKTWVQEHGHLIYGYLLSRDISGYMPWAEVPATAERDARVAIAEVTPAGSLARRLADDPDWLVFGKPMLMREDHGLSDRGSKLRHELEEAGLNPEDVSLPISGFRRKCLTRAGYRFVKQGGNSYTHVEHIESGERFPIAEDEGYRHFTQKIIDEAERRHP